MTLAAWLLWVGLARAADPGDVRVVEVVVPARPPDAFASPDEVLARFADEPDVATVQRWAAEAAQVRPDVMRRWLRASQSFALLPQLVTEVRVGQDWSNDFTAFDLNGNPATSSAAPADQVLTDAGLGHDRTIVVRATWSLADLVMSTERIRVIDEVQDAVELRDALLGEVTRLYFERRRHQVDVLLAPKPDLAGRVRDELRLLELTASLDALTGGRFAAALPAR